MKKILILNGPNLNLIGKRETDIYGTTSFESFFEDIKEVYSAEVQLEYTQSNVEGEMINALQESAHSFDAVILNAGGYTHTSVAIRDAIASIHIPVIEVHISNIHARESFRSVSLTGEVCIGVISGFGLEGYVMAIDYVLHQ